jgi:hypothetical protein
MLPCNMECTASRTCYKPPWPLLVLLHIAGTCFWVRCSFGDIIAYLKNVFDGWYVSLRLCCKSHETCWRVRSTEEEFTASRDHPFGFCCKSQKRDWWVRYPFRTLLHISKTCFMDAISCSDICCTSRKRVVWVLCLFGNLLHIAQNVLTGPKHTKGTCYISRWPFGLCCTSQKRVSGCHIISGLCCTSHWTCVRVRRSTWCSLALRRTMSWRILDWPILSTDKIWK